MSFTALYGEDPERSLWRMPAPWGSLILTECFGTLWQIEPDFTPCETPDAAPEVIARAFAVLEGYLTAPAPAAAHDVARLFELPRLTNLQEFSRSVLRTLCETAPGTVLSYAEIAAKCGRPGAVAAVSRILASNPFPLLIPCHRAAAAGDIKRFDVTDPATFAPKTWLGQQEFSQIAAWLRLHELAFAA